MKKQLLLARACSLSPSTATKRTKLLSGKSILSRTLMVLTLLVMSASGAWAEDTEWQTVWSADFSSVPSGMTYSCVGSVVITDGILYYHQDSGSGDRAMTASFTADAFKVSTNWKMEFDWNVSSANTNSSYVTFSTNNGNVFKATWANYASAVVITDAAGAEICKTLPLAGYNKSTMSTDTHVTLTGDTEKGVYLTIKNGTTTYVDNVLVTPTFGYPATFSGTLGKAVSHMALDNIVFQTPKVAGYVAPPTATVTGANDKARILTLATLTDGATIKYSETAPAESETYDSWTTYNGISLSTEADPIYAVAINGTDKSEVSTIATGAGTTVTLNAPTITLNNFTPNNGVYNPVYSFSSDQSSVLCKPDVTYSYTFDGVESTEGTSYSPTTTGTLVVTVSADGYTSASKETTVDNATFYQIFTQDFTKVSSVDEWTANGKSTAVDGVGCNFYTLPEPTYFDGLTITNIQYAWEITNKKAHSLYTRQNTDGSITYNSTIPTGSQILYSTSAGNVVTAYTTQSFAQSRAIYNMAVYSTVKADDPTITFKKVSGNDRVYTISNTEGQDLYYKLPGDEDYMKAASNSVDVTVKTSGTVYAYAEYSSVKSNTISEEVACGAITLVAPTLKLGSPDVKSNGTIYAKQVTSATSDNSKILGAPEATITCTVDGETVELPYIDDTESKTITVTASADGYTSASTTYDFSTTYAKTILGDYTASENKTGIRKWSDNTHFEYTAGKGWKGVRSGVSGWIQIDYKGMVAWDVEDASGVTTTKVDFNNDNTGNNSTQSITTGSYLAKTYYLAPATFCELTYDANGGSGTMTDSNNPYASGSTVTVLANTFTKPENICGSFKEWNTKKDGTGTSYAAGATFTITENTTLYAQWTVNHTIYTNGTIGETDQTNYVWWTEFSPYTTINKGEKYRFVFTNHGATDENYHNYNLVAANVAAHSTGDNSSYAEYFVLRSDCYGWGPNDKKYYSDSFTSNYKDFTDDEWTTWRTNMASGKFVTTMDVQFTGTQFVMTSNTTDGSTNYTYGFTSPEYDEAESAVVFFTPDHSYMSDYSVTKLYDVTVNAVDGDNNVIQAITTVSDVYDGKSITYAYPAYIHKNGTLYYKAANTSDDYWRTTITHESGTTESVTYTNSNIADVVYYSEAENISGVTTATSTARASNATLGYTSSSDTYKDVVYLPAGTYHIYARGVNGNSSEESDRTCNFKAGDNVVYKLSIPHSNTNVTGDGEFTLTSGAQLSFACGGSSASGLDYFYITGTPTNKVVGAMDCTTGYWTTTSGYVTLTKGQTYHYKFVNHNNGASSGSWNNWILPMFNNPGDGQAWNTFAVIRADNYNVIDTDGHWTGLSFTGFDWDYTTFATRMNGATVDMSVSYSTDGTAKMTSTIKTSNSEDWTYSYTKTGLTYDNITTALSVDNAWLEILEANAEFGTPTITFADNIVTISAADADKIYYTFTKSGETAADPTTSSNEYTMPFAIAESGTVKAMAVKDESGSAVASLDVVYTAPSTDPTGFFTANAIKKDYSVASGTSNIDESYINVSGGSMTVTNEQSGAKTLTAEVGGNKCFTETNNNTYYTVTLGDDYTLSEGDIISFDVYTRDDVSTGLYFSTESSCPTSGNCKAEAAKVSSESDKSWVSVSYVVTDGDGICGEKTFNLYRTNGVTVNFKSFAINRPATIATPSINASGYGTFSCNQPVQIVGAKVYKASVSGSTVTFTKIESGKVPAYNGVMLYKEVPAGNTEKSTATALFTESADAISDNAFQATTTSDGVATNKSGEYNYSLSGTTFYRYTGSFVANKAYLHLSSAPAKELTFKFEDDTPTGITIVNAEENANMADGKYFKNGKLVIIKNGKQYNAAGQQVK